MIKYLPSLFNFQLVFILNLVSVRSAEFSMQTLSVKVYAFLVGVFICYILYVSPRVKCSEAKTESLSLLFGFLNECTWRFSDLKILIIKFKENTCTIKK